MKTIAMLLLGFMFTSCGPMPTLEQLEDQAVLTGDWTAVEKYERTAQRRQTRSGQQCAPGYVSLCEGDISLSRCSCITHQSLSDIFERF